MKHAAEALTIDAEDYHEPASQALEISKPQREIATRTSTAMTPMDMIAQALENGQGIDVIGKLMDLQERWERNLGRKAFDAAVAEAKAEIHPAAKNATGHNNKRYADFAAYAKVVDPIISKFGLSYRFRTKQDDRIHVTCVLSHRDGYSEENTLSGPADSTGSKNAIQAIGSTLTYLQRYTLVQALGLAASDDDDGKAVDHAGSSGPISEDQARTLRKLIDDNGRDIEKFCAYFKIEAIPDLPAKDFERAITALSKKAAQ